MNEWEAVGSNQGLEDGFGTFGGFRHLDVGDEGPKIDTNDPCRKSGSQICCDVIKPLSEG